MSKPTHQRYNGSLNLEIEENSKLIIAFYFKKIVYFNYFAEGYFGGFVKANIRTDCLVKKDICNIDSYIW